MKLISMLAIATILILIGCQEKDTPSADPAKIDGVTMLHSESNPDKQAGSVQAYLDNEEDITDYKAVQVDDQLFIAIEASAMKQAVEQKLEKKIEKKLQEITQLSEIVVTSDQKFMIELSKLEQQDLSKQELKKELDKLRKLSKEQA
ncbi:YhcN/YlaJ family sporulation lipoprotein [Gracilibacillus alcaliphilus]|uniref:YhcN/YlaJ family sporulation lipoprotein n=1 Tax=Gracilibacillus alcaliphilus TaxID=1401441 RepID=UPI00195CFBF6|nr:YhcN/YlaJ family sporulation lipoprotein [Gracilibacillus alcaliphilus]MBM7679361.1 putative RNA-binding protein with PUA-like domain [Gracilibacillus alcaliphilus]